MTSDTTATPAKVPDVLFHYTSLDSLSQILKNRQIKLSRLDKVNDPTEESSRDGKLGKYLFVTCWTSETHESIPFWHIYGHNKRGVRIGLPSGFIESYRVKERWFDSQTGTECTSGAEFLSIIPENDLLYSDHLVANFIAKPPGWFPITYTDDSCLLNPKVFHYDNDGAITVALNRLGEHKPKAWAFENEWRFKLIIHPYGMREIVRLQAISPDQAHLVLRNALEHQKELAFDKYYLRISDSAFSQMQLTLGPLSTVGDRIITESLVREHNPTATISTSNIQLR